MSILLPEYNFEWTLNVTLRTEMAYKDYVSGGQWVASFDSLQFWLGPFGFVIANTWDAPPKSKYTVHAVYSYDGSVGDTSLSHTVELGTTGDYDNRAAATFSFKLTAPAMRIQRSRSLQSAGGPYLLAHEFEVRDTWIWQGGITTWQWGEYTHTLDTDENLHWGELGFGPLAITDPLCFVKARHNVWPISSPLVAVEASVTPPGEVGGISFRGITDVPYRVPATPYVWDNSGSVDWQGDGDTLRLTLGPPPEGYDPIMTNVGSWFWGEGYTVDFSKMRVARSVPGEGYPETQDTEFNDALIWGGFRRHSAYALDYPLKEDTQVVGTGEFAEGEACPLKLSDILGLGELVTSNWHSWVGTMTYYQDGPHGDPLRGDLLPALWDGTIRAQLDYQWMLDNHWLTQENTGTAEYPDPRYDCNLVVDGWLYDQPDTTAEPWEELTVTLADTVDIDLSGKVGSRVSAWTSKDGEVEDGEVGSTASVKLTLTGPGSLARELRTNFILKLIWTIMYKAWPELPRLYWMLGQYPPTAKEYGTWPDEDVCKWNYGYLNVGLVCPVGTLETDVVTLTVQYREIAYVEDNHYIGARRITGDPEYFDAVPFWCEITEPKIVTYKITGLVPGAQTKQVCLMTPISGPIQPNLQIVEHLTLHFPRAGEWQLSALQLAKSEDAATHLFFHVAEDWRYCVNPLVSMDVTSGGLRGRIDNNSLGIAINQDNYSRFELEPVVPFIDFLLSPNALMSTHKLWTLEQFLEIIENVGNGVTVSEPDWANWYADRKSLAVSCDLVPCLDYSESLKLALRCGTYHPASGLAYTPYMWIALGGAAEVLLTEDGAPAAAKSVALTRTGADPEAPEAVETCSADSVGIWRTAYQREAYDYEEHDLGGGVMLYEGLPYTYYIREQPLGAFRRRQVMLGRYAAAKAPHGSLYIDPLGTLHRLYATKTTVYYQRRNLPGSWSKSQKVAEADEAGDVMLFWQDSCLYGRWVVGGLWYRAKSTNGHEWSIDSVETDMKHLRSWPHYGKEYTLGFDSDTGTWYCRKYNLRTGAPLVFANGTEQVAVVVGVDAAAGFWGDSSGALFADIWNGSAYTIYRSLDGGSSWAAVGA
jgi:hypothetical protein